MGAIDGFVDTKEIHYSGSTETLPSNLTYEFVKRLMDFTIALTILVACLPLFLIIAVVIKLDSKGPIFYRRKVVGRAGKAFRAYKLRTMLTDTEPPSVEEFKKNIKMKEDPRITRVGRILRKTSIDELPQLINVMKGDMSLVGPRMISFPELEKFGVWQEKILSVKPGLTGLWQVSGRSDLPYEERVRLNLYYVNHRSLLTDLRILARTIPTVLSMRGAY